jgi:TRAP-type C4-dicarboxylate transport system permease small subunit
VKCPVCECDIPGEAPEACPRCGESLKAPDPLFRVLALIEDGVISVMLISMVVLVLVQIGLRNVCSTGVSGGAEMVRHLVLWVAFLGAGIAAREKKHIKIDIAQRVLPLTMKNLAEVVTGLFTVAVCGILLYASVEFVRSDYTTGSEIVFMGLGIPIWILEVIIPAGYAAVTLRYGSYCANSFLKLLRGGGQP